MRIWRSRFPVFPLLALGILAGTSPTASAEHSWSNYHFVWDSGKLTTTGLLPLAVNDNTISTSWSNVLGQVIGWWNAGCTGTGSPNSACTPSISMPLYLSAQRGNNISSQRKCPPTLGHIDVCHTTYGRNGWLGIASVWVSSSRHITQATVKMNDTYFQMAKYNSVAWRNLVLCQELGHTFGLDHQDENFNNRNLGTCMDYTNLPEDNQWPNYHDFQQVKTIYSHVDVTSTSTTSATSANVRPPGMMHEMNEPSQWGRLVRQSANGRTALYVLDLGGGHRVVTFVIWA
jgi:hypothetical protein